MERLEQKEICLKLDGNGITPDAMGIALIDFLRHAYLLVAACCAEPVGIKAVESNCVLTRLLVPASLSMSVVCGEVFSNSVNYHQHRDAARHLNRYVSSRNAQLCISDAMAQMERRFDGRGSLLPEVEGQTVTRCTMPIYGELQDIGGEGKINAHIKASRQGKSIILETTKETARQLGSRLFTRIGVVADVQMSGEHIIKGRIVEVLNFEPKSFADWMSNALPVLSPAWRGIDAEQYINEIRGHGHVNG